MEDSNEKEKLTLAAIFIATYTALLFSIPQILPAGPAFFNVLIYTVFVVSGGLIDAIFFLYVAFYALELSSDEKTVVSFFKIHLHQEEIRNIKKGLFWLGTDLVFTSFTMPIMMLMQKIQSLLSTTIGNWYGFLIGFIVAITFFGLVGITLRSLFKWLGKSK